MKFKSLNYYSMSLLCGLVFFLNPADAQRAGAVAYVAKAASAPVIDGSIDAIWYDGYSFPVDVLQSGVVDGADDLSARWYGLYDDERLYFLVDITDQYLTSTDGGADWQQDRVEVFFNMDNVKPGGGNGRTGDNYQYAFNWNMPDAQFNSNGDWTGLEWAQVTTEKGWLIEVSIPWTSLKIDPPSAGDSFGIDIAVNDNDGETSYDSVLYWHNAGSALFANIDGAGTVQIGPSFDGNYPPSLQPVDVQIAVEDSVSSIDLAASDLNSGDSLSFSVSGMPDFASLSDNGDGTASISLSPVAGDLGAYQLVVTVSDGVQSDTSLVTLLVQAASGPASPQFVAIEDQMLFVDESLLINAALTDADSTGVSIGAMGLPAFASFVDYRDNTARIEVNPSAGDSGVYPVTLMATDESGNTGTIDFEIVVYGDWRGWPVDSSWNVDLGGAMSLLYVELDPWVYFYGLSNWVYYPDNGTNEPGGWIFIPATDQ